MKLTRRSILFLVVAAVLLVADLVRFDTPPPEALPVLPAVIPEAVVRVQISTPIEKLRMERTSPEKGSPGFEQWKIVSPLEFPADAAQIHTLMRTFAPGIPMEAFVDSGNLEDYGVDDQHGELVELFRAGEDVPAAAVIVGKTAAGPSTFVRIPGSDAVYRADMGGQARYARPAADWRDKVALEIDAAQVTGLTLVRGAESLQFTRGASTGVDEKGKALPGPWQLPNAPFVVDTTMVDAVIHTLARLRAGEIHNPDYSAGFEAPLATATLTLADGSSHTITLGGRLDEGACFVRVSGRDEVFRLSASVGRAMTQPLAAFRDRSLLAFDRADVASIAFVDRGLTVVLSQSDDGTSWAITQPANMDADQKQAIFAVNTLASLRAADIPADTRFDASGARFEVRFRDGRSQALELGQPERDAKNQPLVRVRVPGRAGVFLLRETVFTELRKAFGRG
jgi:hypothetical protein